MVDTTRQYSAAETERMMKLQDVLVKAMAKKITIGRYWSRNAFIQFFPGGAGESPGVVDHGRQGFKHLSGAFGTMRGRRPYC